MELDYHIYNNEAIVASLIHGVLKRTMRMNVAVAAALLPLVLDESVCNLVENRHFALVNVLQIRKNKLLNFNDQYRDALPILINGVSVLLDLHLVSLEGESIVLLDVNTRILDVGECLRLERLVRVFFQLYQEAVRMKLSDLYRQLNIEL